MVVEKPKSKMKPHCDQWNWQTRTIVLKKVRHVPVGMLALADLPDYADEL